MSLEVDQTAILQFDGNASLESLNLSSDTGISFTSRKNIIPVYISSESLLKDKFENCPSWHEPYIPREDIPAVRRTIYRNNKCFVSEFLPTVSVSNMRSLIPKINNLKDDLLERDISLALLSEVWEKGGKKKFKHAIEKMKELYGLGYISTPRQVAKRGGGCAIIVDLKKFSIEKINVTLPKSLEVVYGLVRPKCTDTRVKRS